METSRRSENLVKTQDVARCYAKKRKKDHYYVTSNGSMCSETRQNEVTFVHLNTKFIIIVIICLV